MQFRKLFFRINTQRIKRYLPILQLAMAIKISLHQTCSVIIRLFHVNKVGFCVHFFMLIYFLVHSMEYDIIVDEYDINSDETEDTEFYNFAKGSLTDEEKPMSSVVTEQPPSVTKPTMNDIWGPPTSLYTWTPSDLSGSPSNLTCDAVSAISLSRLLRFEEKKVLDHLFWYIILYYST